MKKLTMPRIIGILCIIIAAFLYFRGMGFFSIAIAGIILLVAQTKHAQESFDKFIETFTQWKIIIITALYDALYWMLVFASVYFYQWRLNLLAGTTKDGVVLDKQAMLTNPDILNQNVEVLQTLFVFLFAGAIILIIFTLITYTLSRGMIWTTLADKKPNKKFFLRFLGLNSLWWLIWLPFLIISGLATKQAPAAQNTAILFIMIAAYFTPILHTLFVSGRKIGESIGNAFAIGISKLFKFVVPYTLAFIVYIIIYQLFRIVPTQQKMIFAASMLLVVLYFAWLRTYLYQIIKKLV